MNNFALDRAPSATNSAWFIGLIISLIVLLIVLIVVCGLMSRKGGKYTGDYANYRNNLTIFFEILELDKDGLHADDDKYSDYNRAYVSNCFDGLFL